MPTDKPWAIADAAHVQGLPCKSDGHRTMLSSRPIPQMPVTCPKSCKAILRPLVTCAGCCLTASARRSISSVVL